MGTIFAFNAKLAKPMGKSKAIDDQTQYRTRNQHTMYMITPNIYTARFLYRIFELYDEKRSSTKNHANRIQPNTSFSFQRSHKQISKANIEGQIKYKIIN